MNNLLLRRALPFTTGFSRILLPTQNRIPCVRWCSEGSSRVPPAARSRTKADKRPPFAYITWRSFAITAAVAAICLVGFLRLKKLKEKELEKQRRQILGKAKIGGSFDLISHEGKGVNSDDLKGQWLLIYFGFTHCPDICPEELEKMAEVVDAVDADPAFPNIQPVFITVDPQRDTPEAVKAYILEFHKKFIGLTGSVEQVAKACKAFRVYFSAGPKDQDEDYIVDHTIIQYLVDPSGHFVDYYGQNKTAEQVTYGIKLNMKKFALLD